MVSATGFDTDLTTIANGEFTLALGDFEGYLALPDLECVDLLDEVAAV